MHQQTKNEVIVHVGWEANAAINLGYLTEQTVAYDGYQYQKGLSLVIKQPDCLLSWVCGCSTTVSTPTNLTLSSSLHFR